MQISDMEYFERIRDCVVQITGLNPAGCRLERMRKPADLPGKWVPDANPMYWVEDECGQLISVVKTYRVDPGDKWMFAGLMASLDLFHQLQLKKSKTISILGFKRVNIGKVAADIVFLSPAPGKGIHEYLPPEKFSLKSSLGAVTAWAQALGELHLNKTHHTRSPPPHMLEEQKLRLARFLDLIKLYPGMTPFKEDELEWKLLELTAVAFKNGYHAGVTHGDPDPTNFCYDPITGLVTMVDMEKLAKSMNENLEPVGSVASEAFTARQLLLKVGFIQGLDCQALRQLGDAFHTAYCKVASILYPSPEEQKYYYFLYTLRKIVWITGIESRLDPTLNADPNYFKIPRDYRNFLLQSLSELMAENRMIEYLLNTE